MSTIQDVARLAGVSTMTVSRVVNNSGYISQATRERVEQAIAQLGYVPNALARSLRFKRTKTLGLILSDITNPFFTTIARGVEDLAREHGFSVIFCNTDEDQGEEAEYISVLLQRQVDGVLLVPASADSASIAQLRARAVPVVVLDRRVEHAQADAVRCDSEQGAYQLIQHLLGLGHRYIAILSGPPGVSTAAERLAGYRRALDEAGIPIAAQQVAYGEYTIEAGYWAAQQILSSAPAPTALFAANNLMALGAFRAARELGIQIPADLSLVTFDDLPQSLVMEAFFTVIAQPAYEIGQRAAELLLARLGGAESPPQTLLLPTELIVRRSSAPPPIRPAPPS